jgi:hypothetical protein
MGIVKQIVTKAEYSALQKVRTELQANQNCHNLEILVYPKLSLIFPLDFFRNPESNLEYLDYQLTFVLAEKPKDRGDLRVAAMVLVTDQEGYNTLNHLSFWNKNNHLIYKIVQKCEEIKANFYLFHDSDGGSIKLIDESKNYSPVKKEKLDSKAFNYAQYRCVVSFCPDSKTDSGEEIFVCHEPSLDSFLELKNKDSITKTVNNEFSRQSRPLKSSFFSKTTVDALVCLGMPNGIPLFGIEFDGSDHNRDEYASKKDRAKNLIFKDNDLPLLRVKSDVFRPDTSDLNHKEDINSLIGRYILEECLTNGSYLKLLVNYLEDEAKRAGIDTNRGSNISSLAIRVNEFFDRQDNTIKVLAEKAASYDSEFEDYGIKYEASPEGKIMQKESERIKFGLPIESILFEESEPGLTITLNFSPNEIERKIMKNTSFRIGPYNVVDVTEKFDISHILQHEMIKHVKSKANKILSYGNPCISDKLLILYRQNEIKTQPHYKRVNNYSCGGYLRNLILWFNSNASNGVHGKEPPSPVKYINKIDIELLSNTERENLERDLEKIHEILYVNKSAQLLFIMGGDIFSKSVIQSGEYTYIQIFFTNYLDKLKKISLLECIEDGGKWREMVEYVRSKYAPRLKMLEDLKS